MVLLANLVDVRQSLFFDLAKGFHGWQLVHFGALSPIG